MTMRTMRRARFVAATLLALMPLLAFAAEEATKAPAMKVSAESVASRIANVRRLLELSSGARRIEASDSEEARKQHEAAKDYFQQAQAAAEAGDLDDANRLLDDSARTMFEAVRILGQPTEIIEKKQNDFDNRSKTIDALLTALRRIGAEGDDKQASHEKAREIEEKVKEARAVLEEGRTDEARTILDEAYEQAKLEIEALREGKTVVRSLDFATIEEEYEYEIDRNDTHRMLIKILLDEKRNSQTVDDMVKKFIERSNELRLEAEQRAARKEFDEAIRLLEQSTKELVRAIRGAGVYIPG